MCTSSGWASTSMSSNELALSLMAVLLVISAAGCRGPQISGRSPHEALAPDSPDQLCLVCHLGGDEDVPASPHELGERRFRGCTGCHGPQQRPRARVTAP